MLPTPDRPAYPRIYNCDLVNHKKYCIIPEAAMQAKLMFSLAVIFIPFFTQEDTLWEK